MVGHCFASVVRQEVDFPVQVVVVPNGCTDGTAAVADAYAIAMGRRGFAFGAVTSSLHGTSTWERAVGARDTRLNS